MRKVLTYFIIFSAVSSSAIPLSACTFNFYGERAVQAAIKSFANQTSNVVKALILGKEKKVDTAQTINDIINQYPNSSIENLAGGRSFNNLGDFTNAWGENGKISFNHFDPNDDYFVATGKGELTQKVNNYKKTNSNLAAIKQATILNVLDNSLLYNQLQNNNNIKNAIFNFFNDAKKTDPTQINPSTLYLKNLVLGKDWTVEGKENDQSFEQNLIDPLSFLLDYFVDNKWSAAQSGTTPQNIDQLKTFMENWKDPAVDEAKNYTEWKNLIYSWSLDKKYYSSWNTTDFNFYRAGVLLNWTFYKIGKDYHISYPGAGYQNRYLGGILSDHIVLDIPISFDKAGFIKDIEQYLPYIVKNPLYLIYLAQSLIPIIKYFGLNGNVFNGTKNLTIGNKYPSVPSQESYNFSDLINNIKNLVNNPEKLKVIVKTLLGWAPMGTVGRNFLYDVSVGKFVVFYPLGDLMQQGGLIPEDIKNELVDTVINFLTTPKTINTINTVADVYNTWVKQYDDKGMGISISIDALRNFLTGQEGLLRVINSQLVIRALFPIFKNKPPAAFDQAQYDEFYQGLGGQLPVPGQLVPTDFVPGSTLDILKNSIGDPNTPLGQISTILFGNSNQNLLGVFDVIINNNNKWIKDNYEAFFDAANNKMGNTFGQSMITETVNNITSNTLQYNFSFTINNKTYVFWVKCISHDDESSFRGTKTFRFTNINLVSIISQ